MVISRKIENPSTTTAPPTASRIPSPSPVTSCQSITALDDGGARHGHGEQRVEVAGVAVAQVRAEGEQDEGPADEDQLGGQESPLDDGKLELGHGYGCPCSGGAGAGTPAAIAGSRKSECSSTWATRSRTAGVTRSSTGFG